MTLSVFVAFNIGTLFNLLVVWKLYRTTLWKYVGIYRFFSLEGLMLLCLFNLPVLLKTSITIQSVVALFIFAVSLLLFVGTIISAQLPYTHAMRFPTRGLYAYLRHPVDAAIFWFGIGAFVLRVDAPTLVFVVLHCVALFEVVKAKEEIMVRLFGGDYLVYAEKTKKLIPFVY